MGAALSTFLQQLDSKETTPPTLPVDIIASEILHRLSVNSLVQFKCVSKFFKTLISSPEFINLHRRRLLILVGENNRLFSVDIDSPLTASFELPHQKGYNTYPPESHRRRGLKRLNPRIQMVGFCNGLLCIRTSSYDDSFIFGASDNSGLYLLNPCTGIYVKIPLEWRNSSITYESLGFGFDYETEDYKVVAIINDFNTMGWANIIRSVMVYSFKSNSWRLVERTFSPTEWSDKRGACNAGALINNHLFHWMYWRKIFGVRQYWIRCFNLRTEQWGNDVPLPDHDQAIEDKIIPAFNLGVLDGHLCLSMQYICKGHTYPTVDVWIMREHGVKESWMKLLTNYDPSSTPHPRTQAPTFVPIAYRHGSQSEVLIWDRNKLIWYDVEDNKAKKAIIRGVNVFANAHLCSGSLDAIARSSGSLVALARDRKDMMLDLAQRSNCESDDGNIPIFNAIFLVLFMIGVRVTFMKINS